MRIYVDGAEVVMSTAQSGDISYIDSWLTLGHYRDDDESHEIDGMLDEVRIWDSARSAAEIGQAMGSSASILSPHMVAGWRFDEGSCGGDNTGLLTLPDTGGVLDGTLSGFALDGCTSNWVCAAGCGTEEHAQDVVAVPSLSLHAALLLCAVMVGGSAMFFARLRRGPSRAGRHASQSLPSNHVT